MTHEPTKITGTPDNMKVLAREILTRERPTLYLGSSPRWGWNDQDPSRKALLSRLQGIVPAMDQSHISDWMPLESLSFSPGISILSGISQTRLEAVLEFLDAERSRTGIILVLDEYDRPLKAHHRLDVKNYENFEAFLHHIEQTLLEKKIAPWGHSPEGRAHLEHLEKINSQKRPDWKWDETRSMNVPEEFRHELAAGLDEHAE